MQPGDLQSILVNFPCIQNKFRLFPCDLETFRQLPSTILRVRRHSVNFRAARRPSINLSTSCAAGRPVVNFCKLSVQPEDLPSIFDNLPCDRISLNFHQFPMQSGDFSSFVKFLCIPETFHQIPSTVLAARRFPSTSVNFQCSQ